MISHVFRRVCQPTTLAALEDMSRALHVVRAIPVRRLEHVLLHLFHIVRLHLVII